MIGLSREMMVDILIKLIPILKRFGNIIVLSIYALASQLIDWLFKKFLIMFTNVNIVLYNYEKLIYVTG